MHNYDYNRLSKMNISILKCIIIISLMTIGHFIAEPWFFHFLNFSFPKSPVNSTVPAPPPTKSTTQISPSKKFKFPRKINKNPNFTQIRA